MSIDMEKSLSVAVGLRIKEFRNKLGLNQKEFANSINRSQQQLSRWEGGVHLIPFDALLDIRYKYGISLDLFDPKTPPGFKRPSMTHQSITTGPEFNEDVFPGIDVAHPPNQSKTKPVNEENQILKILERLKRLESNVETHTELLLQIFSDPHQKEQKLDRIKRGETNDNDTSFYTGP